MRLVVVIGSQSGRSSSGSSSIFRISSCETERQRE